MKNILFLLILFALSVVELSAQTRSSAAQVVTFGVRRNLVQTLGSASNAVIQSSLKMTVGSEWNFQNAAEPVVRSSQSALASGKPSESVGQRIPLSASLLKEPFIASSETPATKSVPSGKLLVTLTE